jgi:hypothetical protein
MLTHSMSVRPLAAFTLCPHGVPRGKFGIQVFAQLYMGAGVRLIDNVLDILSVKMVSHHILSVGVDTMMYHYIHLSQIAGENQVWIMVLF